MTAQSSKARFGAVGTTTDTEIFCASTEYKENKAFFRQRLVIGTELSVIIMPGVDFPSVASDENHASPNHYISLAEGRRRCSAVNIITPLMV